MNRVAERRWKARVFFHRPFRTDFDRGHEPGTLCRANFRCPCRGKGRSDAEMEFLQSRFVTTSRQLFLDKPFRRRKVKNLKRDRRASKYERPDWTFTRDSVCRLGSRCAGISAVVVSSCYSRAGSQRPQANPNLWFHCVAAWTYTFGIAIIVMRDQPPNKSPEPTAVGAVSSAIAVHVASRRWLSFFR